MALAGPLSKLFSLCFRYQVQPSLWKSARVVPIHKKQSRSATKNYRPVSLLSVVSKVMEKIVNTAIINHLEREQALSIHQYGFRQGLSTSDLLTSLNHAWVSELNRGGAVRVVAVDIAGAFDKVSHRGVIHKAASYGIAGPLLGWLSDYLLDRKLQAVVGGASSQPFPIDAGVPQGSILGPTLFLIYVNDACDVLPDGVTPAVYSDDTALYDHIPTPFAAAEVCRTLQAGVDALSKWGAQWRVTFEPTKSQAMTVSRHHRPWPIPSIELNGTPVPESTQLKLLGVTFDAQLTYSHHLRTTAVRATQRIGFFRQACHVLDPPGRATAYRGFIRPVMEYCPLVWMGAAATHLSRLDRVQRRALALIGQGAAMDTLAVRRQVAGLTMLYKLHHVTRPASLIALRPAQATQSAAAPRTRQQSAVSHRHELQLQTALPARSCHAALRSFPESLIEGWNELPPAMLNQAPSLKGMQQFKTRVFHHLKRCAWSWATDIA